MNYPATTLTIISLYLACTILLLFKLRNSTAVSKLSTPLLLLPGFIAFLLHVTALYQGMIGPLGVNLGFYNALSLVGAFITLFTLVSILRHPVEIMGIIVLPITAFTLSLDSINSTIHWIAPGSSYALIFHVLSSLIAYSLIALAALHAIVLSIQNRFLHGHQPGGIIKLLPPLKTMESLLFDAIIIGFVCLSFSLVTGLIFLENMFDQKLAHKTILSITAWFVFATLLIGRWFFGWRGRTAIRWTLSGFISLMLAYFGSKFVLEVLLA